MHRVFLVLQLVLPEDCTCRDANRLRERRPISTIGTTHWVGPTPLGEISKLQILLQTLKL